MTEPARRAGSSGPPRPPPALVVGKTDASGAAKGERLSAVHEPDGLAVQYRSWNLSLQALQEFRRDRAPAGLIGALAQRHTSPFPATGPARGPAPSHPLPGRKSMTRHPLSADRSLGYRH